MATSNPTDFGADRVQPNSEADVQQEAAVLHRVLEFHPETFTMDELIRDLTAGGSSELREVDPIEQACRDLAAAGLLRRPGCDQIIRPTRAAVRYWYLTDGAC